MSDSRRTWLDVRQAAARLGLPPRELYRMIEAGRLPAYKFGRDLKLRAEDVNSHKLPRAGP